MGADDWDAIALIGHSSVLSAALPRNRNLPHTAMKIFVFKLLVVLLMQLSRTGF